MPIYSVVLKQNATLPLPRRALLSGGSQSRQGRKGTPGTGPWAIHPVSLGCAEKQTDQLKVTQLLNDTDPPHALASVAAGAGKWGGRAGSTHLPSREPLTAKVYPTSSAVRAMGGARGSLIPVNLENPPGGEDYFESHFMRRESQAQRSCAAGLPPHSGRPGVQAWASPKPHFQIQGWWLLQREQKQSPRPAGLFQSVGSQWPPQASGQGPSQGSGPLGSPSGRKPLGGVSREARLQRHRTRCEVSGRDLGPTDPHPWVGKGGGDQSKAEQRHPRPTRRSWSPRPSLTARAAALVPHGAHRV